MTKQAAKDLVTIIESEISDLIRCRQTKTVKAKKASLYNELRDAEYALTSITGY